jgi:CDP-6-deoxy-D-xylo-4-hexulose-3-dehydrase
MEIKMTTPELKSEILRLTRIYSDQAHASKLFEPGKEDCFYSGRVFDADEVEAGVSSMLDFWLTLGTHGKAFEKELAALLGVKQSILTNSGSSANLLAISALTSDKLGERRLMRGDEVITVAAGFPTTVTPIIQCGAVPVFIDCDRLTLNANVTELKYAYVEGKTKAVMLAHTLGNPFNLTEVKEFCRKRDLWLIEDSCDSLGSYYDDKPTGSYGDLSTQSFFPAHHITMGEGGAVNVPTHPELPAIIRSFRDWGRDCWCAAGQDNCCGKRFNWQIGDLPYGYDHKNTYRHLGYNLKPLDPQAAIGVQQLQKLSAFNLRRRENWWKLRTRLADLEHVFEFALPTHATKWSSSGYDWDASGHTTNPAWFGFMLHVRNDAPFNLNDLTKELSRARIGHRMLFGGNLTRQPAFTSIKRDLPDAYRIIGDLAQTDYIAEHCLFIGTYPGLTNAMLEYMVETIRTFVKSCTN